VKIRILFAFLACAVAVPAHAQPWRFEDIGSFRYRPRIDPITDVDESEAVARSVEGLGGASGFISWSCHEWGLVIAITASETGDGEPVRMIYRFDRDRPDTVAVTTWPTGQALSVPRELQHSFTTRARSASRLVVRVVHAGGETDRHFDLTGSNRALGMLGCVRDLRRGAPPARAERPAPRRPAAPKQRDLPDGEYEISAVEEDPRLTNRDDVIREMTRSYPAEMRRSGTGGEVELRLRVFASGQVDARSITVVSSTNPVFDEPARTVAAMMRFTPARVNGQPVNVWVSVPIDFTMGSN
jgi:TonB family protein